MFDIIGRRKWFYVISLAVTIPGLLFILLTFVPGTKLGLQFSIAYTGGTVMELHFKDGVPNTDAVLAVLEASGLPGSEVVKTSSNGRDYILIRTSITTLKPPSPVNVPGASASPGTSAGATGSPVASIAPSPAPTAAPSVAPSASPGASAGAVVPTATAKPTEGLPTEGKLAEVVTALQAKFGPIDEVPQKDTVGPVVSAELIQQTFLLIIMGALGIMAWITFRFGDFRMGVTAVGALIHDVIVVVGIFAMMGTIFGLQIDALFVTAMLTVIGFSVHDTIVVFDRIRENRVRHAGEPFEAIVNHSILQTIGRSINTSLTVVITLTGLLMFGGAAIHPFVLALLIGIVSGTYSSIFNASPLLVDWHLWDERRRKRLVASQTVRAT